MIDPTAAAGWDELARARGSLFASPPWLRALARTYDLTISASVLSAGGALVAGIPVAQIDDLAGRRTVCLPFSDYCDPILDNDEQWSTVVAPLLALENPVALRCLHASAPRRDARFADAGSSLWHQVDLSRDLDTIWRELGSSARRNINKARRSGVQVAVHDDRASVASFYALHLETRRRKYKLLAQPIAFFEKLQEEFSPTKQFTLLTAEWDGEPIAAVLFLAWGNTLYYKYNASRIHHLAVRPNDLLLWEGIRFGKEAGFIASDLGMSDHEQEGLVRYKRKFATEEAPVFYLEHIPPAYTDARREEFHRLLAPLTELLTGDDVPVRRSRARATSSTATSRERGAQLTGGRSAQPRH